MALISNSFFLAFVIILGFASNALAQTDKHLADAADPAPDAVRLYSVRGDEVLEGFCAPAPGPLETQHVGEVSCQFMDVQIVSPGLKEIEKERKQLAAAKSADLHNLLGNQSPKGRKQLEDRIGYIRKRADGGGIGPKTKKYALQTVAAMESGNVKAFMNSEIDHDARTCTLTAQTFRLTFKRIGEGVWLSSLGAEGPCQVAKVDRLEHASGVDPPLGWKLTESTVAVGGSGLLCEGSRKEVGAAPEVFTSDFDTFFQAFELPCDFIDLTQSHLVPRP